MSKDTEIQEIDADLMEVPVVLVTKGDRKKYFVREMMGDLLFKFLKENSELMDIATSSDGKVVFQASNLEKMAGAIPSLLKYCLYNEKEELVKEEFICRLPLRVQQKLMDVAQEVNALTAQAAEQAGNLQTGNESGTDSPPGSTAPLNNAVKKRA